MNQYSFLFLLCSLLTIAACQSPEQTAANVNTSPGESSYLASWNEEAKSRITTWVESAIDSSSADYIVEKDRIAVFDNDGTLWSEQPMYFQLAFAIDEIKRMAPEHPEWKTTPPYSYLLDGDLGKFMAEEKNLYLILASTHSNMNTEEFDLHVKNWMKTATHPKSGKHYNEMIFQPMIELLEYLRANEFKTFIVSGGGVDFMRAWTEEAYGIPPYQIVGSLSGLAYIDSTETPELQKIPDLFFNDDKAGKPVGIHRSIGKRPVFAAGNSDGDYQMLQYTSTGTGARFGMIVHHTDSVREHAYDRKSPIGKLEKGLDDAAKYNWLIVDMAKDWKVIYPYELK